MGLQKGDRASARVVSNPAVWREIEVVPGARIGDQFGLAAEGPVPVDQPTSCPHRSGSSQIYYTNFWLRTLVYYYSTADAVAMSDPDRARRTATFHARILAWAAAVDAVAGVVLARKESSGRVGLMGFSNGGFIAVAAAADPRISALVVFYGGVPEAVPDRLARLPPLLALHGQADRTIPIAEGGCGRVGR
jgi:hypothetical protein